MVTILFYVIITSLSSSKKPTLRPFPERDESSLHPCKLSLQLSQQPAVAESLWDCGEIRIFIFPLENRDWAGSRLLLLLLLIVLSKVTRAFLGFPQPIYVNSRVSFQLATNLLPILTFPSILCVCHPLILVYMTWIIDRVIK